MQLDILSEYLGTLVLILLGNGVVASVNYKRMLGNQSGRWVVVTMAWGFAVMMGAIVSQSLGGSGQLNPAVSLFQLISSRGTFEFWRFVCYVVVQILGAITGQIILFFINFKHLKENDLDTIRGSACTSAVFKNREGGIVSSFSYELVGTLVLVGLILAFSRGLNSSSLSALGPLPVTFLIMAIGMSLGAATGYAINPARDFGPRIVYWVTVKFILKAPDARVKSEWGYAWIPVLAPLLAGAIVGGLSLI